MAATSPASGVEEASSSGSEVSGAVATHTGRGARIYVALATLFLGGSMLYVGAWALFWPRSFADWVEFAYHEHFLHDIGAFQIGIGFGLWLAVLWRDALAVGLAAFIVTNTVHAIVHAVDSDLGGRASDPWSLGSLSVVALVALVLRLRQQGLVDGLAVRRMPRS